MSMSAVCPGKLSWDLGFKSHLKDWRSQGLNPQPLVYKVSSFASTTEASQKYKLSECSVVVFLGK